MFKCCMKLSNQWQNAPTGNVIICSTHINYPFPLTHVAGKYLALFGVKKIPQTLPPIYGFTLTLVFRNECMLSHPSYTQSYTRIHPIHNKNVQRLIRVDLSEESFTTGSYFSID